MSHDSLRPGIPIRLRRDTTVNWSTDNPVLKVGETGWDTDLLKVKLGDGVTAWNDLPYAIDGPEGEVDTVAGVAPVAGDVPEASLLTALQLPADTVQELADINSELTGRLSDAALSATYGSYVNLARVPDTIIVGAVTRDANEAATSAPVVWPDGTPGTYTADTLSTDFPGAVDGYHITYGAPVTRTYTQPTITRDSSGAATNVPAIGVS